MQMKEVYDFNLSRSAKALERIANALEELNNKLEQNDFGNKIY